MWKFNSPRALCVTRDASNMYGTTIALSTWPVCASRETSASLPKREELLFCNVLALPKASNAWVLPTSESHTRPLRAPCRAMRKDNIALTASVLPAPLSPVTSTAAGPPLCKARSTIAKGCGASEGFWPMYRRIVAAEKLPKSAQGFTETRTGPIHVYGS